MYVKKRDKRVLANLAAKKEAEEAAKREKADLAKQQAKALKEQKAKFYRWMLRAIAPPPPQAACLPPVHP